MTNEMLAVLVMANTAVWMGSVVLIGRRVDLASKRLDAVEDNAQSHWNATRKSAEVVRDLIKVVPIRPSLHKSED